MIRSKNEAFVCEGILSQIQPGYNKPEGHDALFAIRLQIAKNPSNHCGSRDSWLRGRDLNP